MSEHFSFIVEALQVVLSAGVGALFLGGYNRARSKNAADIDCLKALDEFADAAYLSIQSKVRGINDPIYELTALMKRESLERRLRGTFSSAKNYSLLSQELEIIDMWIEYIDSPFGRAVNIQNRDDLLRQIRDSQRRLRLAIRACMREKIVNRLLGYHVSSS